jgi:hypothetical protein
MLRDHESVMLSAALLFGRLMTVETVDAFLRMLAHLVFTHYRMLQPCMT